MLHEIHDDGNVHWKCVKCEQMNNIHISHDSIQYADSASVQLPFCTNCGTRCSVKVQYSEEELTSPNMRVYEWVPQEQMVEHSITKEMVPGLVPVFMDVGPNPSIAKHQELARQLEAIGKVPKSRGE
jgi:hypothetical protein